MIEQAQEGRILFALSRPAKSGDTIVYLARDYVEWDDVPFVPLRIGQCVSVYGMSEDDGGAYGMHTFIDEVGEGWVRLQQPIFFGIKQGWAMRRESSRFCQQEHDFRRNYGSH